MRYIKGSISSTIRCALRLAAQGKNTWYIQAGANGYSITRDKPPFWAATGGLRVAANRVTRYSWSETGLVAKELELCEFGIEELRADGVSSVSNKIPLADCGVLLNALASAVRELAGLNYKEEVE